MALEPKPARPAWTFHPWRLKKTPTHKWAYYRKRLKVVCLSAACWEVEVLTHDRRRYGLLTVYGSRKKAMASGKAACNHCDETMNVARREMKEVLDAVI